MIGLVRMVWRYRAEITLAVQFLAAIRKSAKEATQEYIQKKIREKLRRQLTIVFIEIGLLAFAYGMTQWFPGEGSALFASAALWAVTLYNLFELLFHTIPEIRAVHRQLRGKVGYALKYVLEISLVTELMQLNIVFLAICVGLGVSTRTYVGSRFSYLKPWKALSHHVAPKHRKH